MTRLLSLGYSKCPNDTFIFHAMTHGKVVTDRFRFESVLKDVEALNQKARTGQLDVTKLSFAALGHLRGSYGLIGSGAALGRGCGPLIVARPGRDLSQLPISRVAVPGLWTTAHLLLGLYLDAPPKGIPTTFDQIMPAVANGKFDFGVIIHEGRFTFESYGLMALLDLGQWWESETGLPIPLGGIAVSRHLGADVSRSVEKIIRDSIQFAFKHPEVSQEYVKQHAQEMTQEVIDQHIALYVNDDSIKISPEGMKAINILFERGQNAGLLPNGSKSILAY